MGAPPPPPKDGGCCGGIPPLPAPRATPGTFSPLPPPEVLLAADDFILGGGGPSTATLTTFSPRKIINPNVRFSTRSSTIAALLLLLLPVLFFDLERTERYSSESTNTKFKCLSNAKNVPTIVRPSMRLMRNRCSMYRNNLDPLPEGG